MQEPSTEERVLYRGSRKSGKFVRCYPKTQLGVFRVELQFQSPLLHNNCISTIDDLQQLPDLVQPKHLQFVDVNWSQLEKYLRRRFHRDASRILTGARKRATSLKRLRRYLRRKGIP